MELELSASVKNKEDERPSLQTQHLAELVCPVCYEYMHPPIMLCERGHSICELCHELMSECPLCQGRLTCRRSSTLEALTAVIMFPCKHCEKRFHLEDLDSHNCFKGTETDHSPTATCILGQVYGDCTWSGPATDMSAHCSKQHPQQFSTNSENVATWESSQHYNLGVQNAFIIDLTTAMFVIVQKFDSKTRSLCWNLSCESADNEPYDYAINVCSTDGPDVPMQRTQIENAFSIMSFFPSSNEIIIGVDKISTFLNKDNILKYKIVISKRCDVPRQEDSHIDIPKFRSSQTNRRPEFETEEKIDKTSCIRKAWSSIVNFYNSIKKLLHL